MIYLALIVLVPMLFAEGNSEKSSMSQAEWEEWAQLGEHRPIEDDWGAIEKAALEEEGPLVVYSLSSRVFEFGRTFYKKYGIKVEAHDITTPSLLEKIFREQEAGLFNADVILVDDIPTVYNEYYQEGRMYNFVPTNLKSVIIDEAKTAPLAIHHYGARGIAYNSEFYDEAPIDSWWDLTRPEWKGKIIMKDPLNSGAEFNTFATFIQHYVDMEEAYKDEFGVELITSDEAYGKRSYPHVRFRYCYEGRRCFGAVRSPVGYIGLFEASYHKGRAVECQICGGSLAGYRFPDHHHNGNRGLFPNAKHSEVDD